MHAILLSIGTHGDVFPFMDLGIELRIRGHQVTLCANASYEEHAQLMGFTFRSLISHEESSQVLDHPHFWNHSNIRNLTRSVNLVTQWGIRFFDRHYALIDELLKPDNSVLITSPAVLAARVIQEQREVPMASVVITPWMIPSIHVPPVMPAGLTLPSWAPAPLGKLYFRLINATGDFLIGRHLNRFRRGLGMKPVKRLFQWWLHPRNVVGLFPAWYAPPQPDWPPQMQLAGFPGFDGRKGNQIDPELKKFCTSDSPPVAFTFGTGLRGASSHYQAAVDACDRLQCRGLFVTRFTEQLPSPLPAFIRHVEFAPFEGLFPHCAAVVHHGGIGTTARALAAAAPQLILPFAFDQQDNAARVKRLGAGDALPGRRVNGPNLAQALNSLLHDGTRQRCRSLAGRFQGPTGQVGAANYLENLWPHSG